MQFEMRRNILFILILSIITIGNESNAIAQTYSSIEGTIWEYVWGDNIYRDFIAFVSENKSLSYSFELDEFEISNYIVDNDTIVVTTTDVDNAHNERPIVSITYYYKNRNDFLDFLFVIFTYEDGYRKEIPTKTYRLYRKDN